jgi:hypothetical protein
MEHGDQFSFLGSVCRIDPSAVHTDVLPIDSRTDTPAYGVMLATSICEDHIWAFLLVGGGLWTGGVCDGVDSVWGISLRQVCL